MKRLIGLALLLVMLIPAGDAPGQLFRRGRTTTRSAGTTCINGVCYPNPICSRANCAMCNSRRAAISQARVTLVPVSRPSRTQTIIQSVPVQSAPVIIDDSQKLIATPQAAIDLLVPELCLQPGAKVLELGCGDARFLTAVAQYYPVTGVGFEINQQSVLIAKQRVGRLGLRSRVRIEQADVLSVNLPQADLVYLYHYPSFLERVRDRIRPGTKVISYMHPVPGVQCTRVTLGGHVFWEYTVPQTTQATVQPIVYTPQAAERVIELPSAQGIELATDAAAETAGGFRRALIRGIRDARRNGKITYLESLQLRVATLSPAFVRRAQELAVTQMVMSGVNEDHVPLDADGRVIVAEIDWESLKDFIEFLIPILIELLKLFGAIA